MRNREKNPFAQVKHVFDIVCYSVRLDYHAC